MAMFLLVMAGVFAGYLIPVLVSLIFTLLVGRIAPRVLSQGGRIKSGFVVLHGLVWVAASVGSGYVIGLIVPEHRWSACVGSMLIVCIALLANVTAMKKQQGPLQIGGMLLGTAAGFAGGLLIFLKTLPVA